MTGVPLHIRLFESLQLASIFIVLIVGFAMDNRVFEACFGAAMMVALTLLVSRGRKNWARWVWLAMIVLGGALVISDATTIFARSTAVTIAIALLQTLLQAVGLVLLFTPQSSDWIRGNPAEV